MSLRIDQVPENVSQLIQDLVLAAREAGIERTDLTQLVVDMADALHEVEEDLEGWVEKDGRQERVDEDGVIHVRLEPTPEDYLGLPAVSK